MTDGSGGPVLDLDALEREARNLAFSGEVHRLGDVVAKVPVLVAALRETEGDAASWRLRHKDACGELADLRAKLAASEVRAETAEAAAAQMRACLTLMHTKQEVHWDMLQEVLFGTDAGKGWVNPEDAEQLTRSREGWKADAEREMGNAAHWRGRGELAEAAHAEVVRERDVARGERRAAVTLCTLQAPRLRELKVQAAVMREALEMCLRDSPPDPMFSAAVHELGERVGYGVTMSQSARLWREMLTAKYGAGVSGGAFTVGPCRGTVESALAPGAGAALLARLARLEKVAKQVVDGHEVVALMQQVAEGGDWVEKPTGEFVCEGCGAYLISVDDRAHGSPCIRLEALAALEPPAGEA